MPKPGSTSARGYGQAHQKIRRQLEPIVAAGGACCWRCRKPILPGSSWHVGHDDWDRSIVRGAEHELCNLRAAGRKGGLLRRKRSGRRRPRVLAPLSTSRSW